MKIKKERHSIFKRQRCSQSVKTNHLSQALVTNKHIICTQEGSVKEFVAKEAYFVGNIQSIIVRSQSNICLLLSIRPRVVKEALILAAPHCPHTPSSTQTSGASVVPFSCHFFPPHK